MKRLCLLISIFIGVAHAAPLNLYVTPFETKKEKIIFRPSPFTVVNFGTTWCPVCQRTNVMIDRLKKRYPDATWHTFLLDDPQMLHASRPFGVDKSVPLVLIADRSGVVVKRYETAPSEENLDRFVKRLYSGRLENGTLPASQRVDLWLQDRKGM